MSDRDIKKWDLRLKDHVEKKWDNYQRKRINLDIAHNDLHIAISGEYLYVEEVSSPSASATIRLDRNTKDTLDLVAGTKIETIFTEFYITNTAQVGEWIDLLIGINFKYEKPFGTEGTGRGPEAQPAIIITNALADTDTQGAANVCKEVLIQADSANAGKTWLNFGAAAVESQCHVLDPGDLRRASISNTNRIHALFKIANDNLFVIYEV